MSIFSQYDSLEKIYENIDNLKSIDGIGPSLIKNLINEKDIAFMSRELAKIFTNLDITVEEDGLQYGMDRRKLYSLCKVLEFKMFIKKLGLEEKPQNPTLFSIENLEEKKESPKIVEEENIEFTKEINLDLSNRELLIIDNENSLNEQKEYLTNYKKIASIYYEGLGIILSTEDKDFYFPLNHGGLLAKNIDRNLVVKFISELDIKFISYNFKALLNLGISFKSMYMDMMIAYHLISSQTKIDPIIPITEYSKLVLF